MALVTQEIFDDLLKQQAIANDGVILRTIRCNGGVHSVGDSPFTVNAPKAIAPVVPATVELIEEPKPTVSKPHRTAKPKGGDA
jgi:hypothetical protein